MTNTKSREYVGISDDGLYPRSAKDTDLINRLETERDSAISELKIHKDACGPYVEKLAKQLEIAKYALQINAGNIHYPYKCIEACVEIEALNG